MFWQIFLFEIKYRLRRADSYLYFLAFFIATTFSFAYGAVPGGGQTFVNAPVILDRFYAIFSIFMMVVTAAIMGAPLYRDLEYNTHEYYLSYPITRNGYFWGRFLGSFLFVAIIGSALVWGSMLGVYLGPRLGWLPGARVAPAGIMLYLKAFFFFPLPNLFLTSCIFFGLVAHTRNNKVIYTGGVLLYLGYVMSIFIIHSFKSTSIAFYADAFGFTPIMIRSSFFSPEQLNHFQLSMTGLLLLNRVIWFSISLLILLITWLRFDFVRFFSGKPDKRKTKTKSMTSPVPASLIPRVVSDFKGSYNRRVLLALVKIEWLGIVRDNYFRLILGMGTLFLCFLFWFGGGRQYNIPNLPRTTVLMDVYNDNFILFIFLILMFYTGEVIQREKASRFALINDALPPGDWILYCSKLIALFLLGLLLASIPILAGIGIQLAKGFSQINLPVYFIYCYGLSLPIFLEIIMLCFAVHVLVNNKFAGHAVALMIWLLMLTGHSTGRFDYRMLLYSYTPDYWVTDMDGLGPSAAPQLWFNLYWMLAGGLLVMLAAVFYFRGMLTGFRERIRLAGHRFTGNLRWLCLILLLAFLVAGSYNYYNVSYLNEWLTVKESNERKAIYEKQLKHYADLPLPGITRLKVFTDMYPEDRHIHTRAYVGLVNHSGKPIDRLLLNGDQLLSYSIKYNGRSVPYASPLVYPRPLFSFFRQKQDTAMARLYLLPHPLAVGDSASLEIETELGPRGFSINFSALTVQHNGTATNDYLPELGYDDDDELTDNGIRQSFGLSPRNNDQVPPPGDSLGVRNISFSVSPDLVDFEATVSTAADQQALAAGECDSSWSYHNRRFYHYTLRHPESYFRFPLLSGRYAVQTKDLTLDDGKITTIELDYHPAHGQNLQHFNNALADGLPFFSKAFGDYPFHRIRVTEAPAFLREGSFPGTILFGENYAWNARFNGPDDADYIYFLTAGHLAEQWWMFQVAPNHTQGSPVLTTALSKYSASILFQNKFGEEQLRNMLQEDHWWYTMMHSFRYGSENPLLTANADYVWANKGGIVLYGLSDLMGQDSLNAILRSFHDDFAFRNKPPYAGTDDLLKLLKARVPDSLQYYLSDSWEKITLYDNRMAKLSARSSGNSKYKVHLEFSVRKIYVDKTGKEQDAPAMNDFIDIGVFGERVKGKDGRSSDAVLSLKKYKLTAGAHSIDLVVDGKPVFAGIDPYHKLIDRAEQDNNKDF